MHAAASRGGDERLEARVRGDGRRAGRGGWVHDPFRGHDGDQDDPEVHDGRHAAARGDGGPAARALRCGDPRRGARAHARHRHPLRPHQGSCGTAARPQADRDECNARRGQVPGLLRLGAADEGARPAAPGRDLLHARARARLPRGRHPHRRAGAPVRGRGRHLGVLDWRARDRGRMPQDEAGNRQSWRPGARRAGAAALLDAADGTPAPDLRPAAAAAQAGRPKRAKDHLLDQHRRDLAHHRRHRLRRRPGIRQAKGVQPAHPRGEPARLSDIEGVGPPARGPRRADAAGQVLPALHREGLQEGAHGADLPRDSALQPGLCRAAAEEAGD
mmetsp:Transcript_22785/g.47885  ORF Transcript_22785/g.47885 Transcript_22785/m.47885 type:complete len:331 (-) Transcript_22785:1208-2200(-)